MPHSRANPLGGTLRTLFAALTFAAVAVLRLPLIAVLAGIGTVASALAYRALQGIQPRNAIGVEPKP